ncbi:hypothetical protein AWH56_023410 [Anaerobacillus isosaccharinicus]|uniref:Uncharacterized protein n=1 Tax=Anaerobacillus isosaccharinicus TaxID=1532552 RepID=A0A1S2LIN9_9BACI|nr:hypothetical protein [Anaerobacillus isosaccharinicus]MBA5586146.1 hypothetical protein [Anaerobacillus isosaccharinicus]QOY35587.1 hypothetical protein AWH56_023410 [Anaerobacillus isosaccharinicus]
MKLYRLFFVIAIFLLLIGCMDGTQTDVEQDDTGSDTVEEEPADSESKEEDEELAENEKEEKEVQEGERKPETPEEAADEIVLAMDQKDMKKLASYVHPTKGVLFSPYAYVNVDEDKVFTAQEVEGLMDDETIYTWGVFDGKGNPIEMTFADYFDRFIYDEAYVDAEEKSVNERIGQGNTIDNTEDIFPDATVVEYHFSSIDPQYEGMDWRSLRLVLEEENGEWFLVAIIHDEWTI